MSVKVYKQNEQFVVGVTLKNEQMKDDYNMAFTTKEHKENVIFNRKHLAKFLNTNLANFVCANQTHSTNLYKVMKDDNGCGAFSKSSSIPNVDALYTFESDLVLCTFSADCVPIIFYNESSSMIGVIHSGWKGIVNEITVNVFDYLKNVERCRMQDMIVFLGPAISQEKFEIDKDVYEQYKKLHYAEKHIYYKSKTNKYHVDNKEIVKEQCQLIGIPSDHIKIDSMCTFLSEKGFSYRQNKTKKRHLGFIMKK